MNDNEYWIRFWLMGFTTIATIVVVLAITSSFRAPDTYEEEFSVTEMKTLLDSGYTKVEIGCDKPRYSYVKAKHAE